MQQQWQSSSKAAAEQCWQQSKGADSAGQLVAHISSCSDTPGNPCTSSGIVHVAA